MADSKTAEAEAKAEAELDTILPDESKGEAPKETEAEEQSKGEETKEEPAESEAESEDEDKAEANRKGYLARIRQKDNQEAKLDAEKQQALSQVEDERDKKIAALEWDQYITKVTQARERLVTDDTKVQAEIPIFNPQSEEYNKEVHDRALQRFARDSLLADDNGDIIGYRTPLYEYMKEESDLYHAGTATGTKKRTQSSAKMDAAAETPGGTSNRKEEPEDPFMKGFDSYK